MSVMSSAVPAPKKRILVPLYSQSGQLAQVVEQLLAPLREADRFEIKLLPLVPAQPYPFPWPFFRFLDVFPESIQQRPGALQALALADNDAFDLIILPYQVWYLAPSLPVQALLQQPQFARLVQGKPVLTVIACRNMWHLAQETMKAELARLGARLLDNVVLTDQGSTLATFITVPRWLLTGRQNAFWGLPAAGVAATEIARARRFGLALRDALERDEEQGEGPLLAGLAAVTAEPSLLLSERAGSRSFKLWSKLVRAVGGPGSPWRRPVLALYISFLVLLILTVVPLSLTVQRLLRPFLRARLEAAKVYFEAPSGSGRERLEYYE